MLNTVNVLLLILTTVFNTLQASSQKIYSKHSKKGIASAGCSKGQLQEGNGVIRKGYTVFPLKEHRLVFGNIFGDLFHGIKHQFIKDYISDIMN